MVSDRGQRNSSLQRARCTHVIGRDFECHAIDNRHPIHLQWGPSHVGLPGNEVADDRAKAATSNPVDLENHMVLTSTEIYSRAKE
ncbi:hypothetical protein TNCV_3377551 [Trichonephila clavipes]|nr:hypothetical protein TNCV_3377551 [Trichonephila clavipes]